MKSFNFETILENFMERIKFFILQKIEDDEYSKETKGKIDKY